MLVSNNQENCKKASDGTHELVQIFILYFYGIREDMESH
jgi:hypothetical protein